LIQHQRRRVLAGSAIIALLVAGWIFVSFISEILALFERRYELVAVFPSAPRLRLGAEVWIGGNPVGRVKAIGFRPIVPGQDPSVAVLLELPREHRSFVRADSKVRITSARLIGDPVVDIVPGSVRQRELQDGDTLYADVRTSAFELIARMHELRYSVDSLGNTARTLPPLVSRAQRRIPQLTANLERIKTEVAILRTSFAQGSASQLLNDDDLQLAFAHLAKTAGQLEPAFARAAKRYSDPALREAVHKLQKRARSISAQVNLLELQLANGSLSRFARDSALMKALHKTQIELDSLIAETKRNPLRFWLGSEE
jgi:hypothetical protein